MPNVQAYYKNSSGAIVASGQPIMVPTGSATCQTLSVCAGNADEVKTVISYGAQTAGVANNLLPVSASSGSGDGALTSSASVTYDIIGNRITVDGPLAGSADTVRTRYNAVRQVVGVVSPDPDGPGPLRHRAQRVGYNVDGLPVLTEVGTVLSQSDADWSGFVSLQQSASVYDGNARLSRESVTAGGVTYSVVDYSYDGLGRSDCVAQRLNPAVWGTLSAACTAQGAGSSGPDRIARTLYDEVGRVREVQTALGTSAAQNVLQSYNPNGTLETLTDGRGNKTTYAYDGFDRLVSTRFPSPVSVGVSSATDFEALTYDGNGNVTVRRVRDGNLINYTYDNLDRVTFKDVPTLAYEERDVSYTYDLLGRLKSATKADGFASNISYDALGRKLSETNGLGAIYFAYDSAGRRTQLTHGDGFYVTYEYLVSGETLAIRESGAAALGTYAYDDLGRRTSLTRGNGSVTTYSYDPASRLTSLGHDFAEAAHDVTSSFTYTAASQIGSRSRSNDLYAFTAAVAGSRAYINNGLNQHTSAAGAAQSYDGRGNLAASGVDSYVYTSENRLASFTKNGAVQSYLGYDGLGQLALVSPQVPTPKLDYLMVADGAPQFEFNSVTGLLRRHVHGPGSDEPLLTYEGAGLSDKRYLHADERGSIIAISNASGQVTQINAYDDYGIPQGKNASGAPYSGGTATTNFGRFGYTGQAWLPEVGLYHYKARAYSPTMGRFMQTDPIGYGDGVNLYAYVGGDPVNFNDPSGLGAASRDVDPKRIIPIDCPFGFICVRAYDAPDPPPRGLGFLLSANVAGDRGTPSFGERNDGGDNGAPGEACPPPTGIISTARNVLEGVATASDIASVGFTAAGITAPVAIGTEVAGLVAEGAIFAINIFDAKVNGNAAPLIKQGSELGARLIPGGRALQAGLRAVRTPTAGILARAANGRFIATRINNKAVPLAGQKLTEKGAGAIAEAATGCRKK